MPKKKNTSKKSGRAKVATKTKRPVAAKRKKTFKTAWDVDQGIKAVSTTGSSFKLYSSGGRRLSSLSVKSSSAQSIRQRLGISAAIRRDAKSLASRVAGRKHLM